MCPYHKNGKCACTASFVDLPRDRIVDHCRGNYDSCPAYRNAVTGQQYTYSKDMYAQNDKSMRKGGGMRLLALVGGGIVFFLVFKAGLGFGASLGSAVIAAIIVLMFTNKWH